MLSALSSAQQEATEAKQQAAEATKQAAEATEQAAGAREQAVGAIEQARLACTELSVQQQTVYGEAQLKVTGSAMDVK